MKAKLKVLYQDGNLDITKPWTFRVTVREWQYRKYEFDYVMQSEYVTGTESEKQPFLVIHDEMWYKVEIAKQALYSCSQGKAIRIGVDEYRRLEAFVKEQSSNE